MASPRALRRLARHHLPLAALSAAANLTVVWLLRDAERAVFRWSMATAYVGLALLAATLVPGALSTLRGRRHPTSTDLRRDIGIWAAIVSIAHFVFGWQVHMRHRWEYFLQRGSDAGPTLLPRVDLFGFANWSGLAALLLVGLLLALSSDRSLRALGAARWKRLQRWNPALFALVAVHGAAYMVSERRSLPWVVAGSVTVCALATLRLAARRRRPARALREPLP